MYYTQFHEEVTANLESARLIARTYFWTEKIPKKRPKLRRLEVPGWTISPIIGHNRLWTGHELYIIPCRIKCWLRITLIHYPDIFLKRNISLIIINTRHNSHIYQTKFFEICPLKEICPGRQLILILCRISWWIRICNWNYPDIFLIRRISLRMINTYLNSDTYQTHFFKFVPGGIYMSRSSGHVHWM